MLSRSSRVKAASAILVGALLCAGLLVAGAFGIRSCVARAADEQRQREVIAYSAGVSDGMEAGYAKALAEREAAR